MASQPYALPAVLRVSPPRYLHLQPRPRNAADVGAGLVLRDVALEARFEHLVPRHEAVRCELTYGEDSLASRHELLEPRAAFSQRALGLVAACSVEKVEHHQQRGRRHGLGVRVAQPIEPRPELAVEDGDLPVEYESGPGKGTKRCSEIWESSRVINAIATQQADSAAHVPKRKHPPSIHLFLVNPAVTVEGLRYLGGDHRGVLWQVHVALTGWHLGCSVGAHGCKAQEH